MATVKVTSLIEVTFTIGGTDYLIYTLLLE